nr:MAG TPA: hypothetical protein [Caudoviricetes sp.]
MWVNPQAPISASQRDEASTSIESYIQAVALGLVEPINW